MQLHLFATNLHHITASHSEHEVKKLLHTTHTISIYINTTVIALINCGYFGGQDALISSFKKVFSEISKLNPFT